LAGFAGLISGLSHDKHLKGRQFERVCRWYLENDPVFQHQIRKVWLWKDWLGRWGADAGIDLVAETHTGELWAVQAKAYAPSASVTKADIDTFLSESSRPQFALRLLVATTDHISHNAHRTIEAQEKPVRLVTASELGKAALDWPEHPDDLKAVPLPKNSPRPHQQAAIEDVLKGFGEAARGQLIMACGTGKTMVSMWVWEALEAPVALVVLPSISLLAQTVREWCVNARVEFDFLAVCSDESVTDSDLIVRSPSELPFATTTEAEQIAVFLAGGDERRRVIFSTYHSTPRIAEAVDGDQIDLVVADEAHRCAGRTDGGFATILDDEAIAARRRLFMTATPRFLAKSVKKAAEAADVEVVSMDDEAVFGPTFHKLTFGQAIAKDLLTDYQVAIIGVDDRRFLEMAENSSLVQHGAGKVTDARTLAAQAALLKGMAKYDLRRCVTFHSRVARARQFADSLGDVTDSLPPDERPVGRLWADHVSGAMRSASRDARLDRLRTLDDCDRGLLANARCLGEGVDVPSLDAVAFIDPRGSQIDIIQAVGRVIRNAEDKQAAVVVLPVFIPSHEDAEAALEDSAFFNVWRVLNALRAHDDVLSDELDALRTELGSADGRPQHPGKIHLDLPANVPAGFLAAFDARLLARTTSSWHYWYGCATRFAEQHGHLRVPSSRAKGERSSLGSWIEWQRGNYRRGVLAPDRIAALDALTAWSWEPYEATWDACMAALQAFLLREGHLTVPKSYLVDGRDLALWMANRRMDFRKGILVEEQIAQLEALHGWSWTPKHDRWDRSFMALQTFVEREGHSLVPQSWVESGLGLGRWVSAQRSRYRRGTLEPERVARLEGVLDWCWDGDEGNWQRNLAAVRRYLVREGHADVPANHVEDDLAIGNWVTCRRAEHRKGRLSSGRVAELEALRGWSWNPIVEQREAHLAALARYVGREGHARVPAKRQVDGLELGQWVRIQRQRYKTKRLERSRIAELEAFPGWSWAPDEDRWQANFSAMQAFAEREGTSAVPHSHDEAGVAIGKWAAYQRRLHRLGRLSSEHVHRLEQLPGWKWDSRRDQLWEANLRLLRRFANREGHARVPSDYVEGGVRLGGWVGHQREDHAAGRLDPLREASLERVSGWTWDPYEDAWQRATGALQRYVERESHARVPIGHTEDDVALGAWVSAQRQGYRAGRLSKARVDELGAIPGWVWSVH